MRLWRLALPGPSRTRLGALGCCLFLTSSPALAACGGDDPAPPASDPTAAVATSLTTSPAPTQATLHSEDPAPPARTWTTSPRPTVDPYAGQPLIERVDWTRTVDGDRLLVFPTRAGRDTTFPGAEQRAWTEILALSPAADSPGMYDQFVCHWHWARLARPDKPSWNLEPWRPAVGYEGTVAASCNPGGPER